MVESGNFCGGLTGYLALLKRTLCPSCQFVSLDPGGYRRKRHVKFTCNQMSLEWIGLREQVTFIDEPSPALVLEQPVGFVYYDGGKTRFCNAPLQSYLEDKYMVGALIGLDDVWQAGTLPHAHGHHGQIMFVHEMVQSGDWLPVVVPPIRTTPGSVRATLVEEVQRTASGSELADSAALLRENTKQALLVKVRSRFGQPGEMDGRDAVRVSLVERGVGEVATRWVELAAQHGV